MNEKRNNNLINSGGNSATIHCQTVMRSSVPGMAGNLQCESTCTRYLWNRRLGEGQGPAEAACETDIVTEPPWSRAARRPVVWEERGREASPYPDWA